VEGAGLLRARQAIVGSRQRSQSSTPRSDDPSWLPPASVQGARAGDQTPHESANDRSI
jgi:hypothetical protein